MQPQSNIQVGLFSGHPMPAPTANHFLPLAANVDTNRHQPVFPAFEFSPQFNVGAGLDPAKYISHPMANTLLFPFATDFDIVPRKALFAGAEILRNPSVESDESKPEKVTTPVSKDSRILIRRQIGKDRACWRCREAKKKCSGQFPCTRCRTQNCTEWCQPKRPVDVELVGATVVSSPSTANVPSPSPQRSVDEEQEASSPGQTESLDKEKNPSQSRSPSLTAPAVPAAAVPRMEAVPGFGGAQEAQAIHPLSKNNRGCFTSPDDVLAWVRHSTA
eukprot:2111733-Rhodomonas_salina.3